jgi:hypothetical protein
MYLRIGFAALILASSCVLSIQELAADQADDFLQQCASTTAEGQTGRVVCADVAALDQTLVYNRFGSFNPFGMMFALRRDLSPLVPEETPTLLTADDCAAKLGTEPGHDGDLAAGEVRLKDCKRPRPLVLRVNVGDTLLVRVNNYLHVPDDAFEGDGTDSENVVDFSRDFCKASPTDDDNRASVHPEISRGDQTLLDHGEVS